MGAACTAVFPACPKVTEGRMAMNENRRFPTRAVFGAILGALLATAAPPYAKGFEMTQGQSVYVPAYSHIYVGDREMQFYLAATLSIRNTDPDHPIQVVSADYLDSKGKRLQAFISSPKSIAPLATERFVVKESDKAGGSGAKFMVTWQSQNPVAQPIVEAVMVSTRSNQGISFISRGQVVREHTP
jgi:hypothetical protein